MLRAAARTARAKRPPSSGNGAVAVGLPDYAPTLAAFHAEFAGELQAILARLPLTRGQRVLDVACGDGQYAAWLAARVGQQGSVTAVDASTAWLKVAARTLRNRSVSGVTLCQADARHLPYAHGSFDFVWCAQSLYSLPDLMVCLAEMVRVLRTGGTLAVLEDDTLHHILLPWPVDLELEVRTAELAALRTEAVAPARFYVGRWTSRLLRRVGLRRVREHALAATRQTPLSPSAERFFAEYLAKLRWRVDPLLAKSVRQRFERLVDPASRRYLLKQPDFVAVCLDRVVWGVRPRGIASR